jgi:hypothetical protein
MFERSGDSPSDRIAKKPTDEQMEWACKVAAAQEKLIREYDLDALTYYIMVHVVERTKHSKAASWVGLLLTARAVFLASEKAI